VQGTRAEWVKAVLKRKRKFFSTSTFLNQRAALPECPVRMHQTRSRRHIQKKQQTTKATPTPAVIPAQEMNEEPGGTPVYTARSSSSFSPLNESRCREDTLQSGSVGTGEDASDSRLWRVRASESRRIYSTRHTEECLALLKAR
jgi:hypothetical protein